MYCARSDGRSKVRFFTDEMNAESQARLTMDKNLRLALDRGEFFLVYQPQIEIETGRITGLEALIRWRHPELGLIQPDRFISIA
jgi:predicted signal transduction protein with EAL and GGDEF domain